MRAGSGALGCTSRSPEPTRGRALPGRRGDRGASRGGFPATHPWTSAAWGRAGSGCCRWSPSPGRRPSTGSPPWARGRRCARAGASRSPSRSRTRPGPRCCRRCSPSPPGTAPASSTRGPPTASSSSTTRAARGWCRTWGGPPSRRSPCASSREGLRSLRCAAASPGESSRAHPRGSPMSCGSRMGRRSARRPPACASCRSRPWPTPAHASSWPRWRCTRCARRWSPWGASRAAIPSWRRSTRARARPSRCACRTRSGTASAGTSSRGWGICRWRPWRRSTPSATRAWWAAPSRSWATWLRAPPCPSPRSPIRAWRGPGPRRSPTSTAFPRTPSGGWSACTTTPCSAGPRRSCADWRRASSARWITCSPTSTETIAGSTARAGTSWTGRPCPPTSAPGSVTSWPPTPSPVARASWRSSNPRPPRARGTEPSGCAPARVGCGPRGRAARTTSPPWPCAPGSWRGRRRARCTTSACATTSPCG